MLNIHCNDWDKLNTSTVLKRNFREFAVYPNSIIWHEAPMVAMQKTNKPTCNCKSQTSAALTYDGQGRNRLWQELKKWATLIGPLQFVFFYLKKNPSCEIKKHGLVIKRWRVWLSNQPWFLSIAWTFSAKVLPALQQNWKRNSKAQKTAALTSVRKCSNGLLTKIIADWMNTLLVYFKNFSLTWDQKKMNTCSNLFCFVCWNCTVWNQL